MKPLVIGLTGSIGMGKSTTARFFAALGVPSFNADEAVHALIRPGTKAFWPIAKAFPEALFRGRLSRERLGQAVFGKPERLKQLEAILHPFVWQEKRRFLREATKNKVRAVLLEIPLLFETGMDKECDLTVCVSADPEMQKKRVLKRKGMTESKLSGILARQIPDVEKRRLADYVIVTDEGFAAARRQVHDIFRKLTAERKNA